MSCVILGASVASGILNRRASESPRAELRESPSFTAAGKGISISENEILYSLKRRSGMCRRRAYLSVFPKNATHPTATSAPNSFGFALKVFRLWNHNYVLGYEAGEG